MIIYKNQVLEAVKSELFRCMSPVIENDKRVITTQEEPEFIWTGDRMPLAFLGSIVRFMQEVYKKFKSEVQVRMYYDPSAKSLWQFVVLSQEVTGATTKETGKEIVKMSPTAIEIGTIHSHPSFSASQSGEDQKSEERTNGIHITIGDINSSKFSWHFRAYYKGILHKVNLGQLIQFNFPDEYNFMAGDVLEKLPQIVPNWNKIGVAKELMDKISEPSYGTGFASSNNWGNGVGGSRDWDKTTEKEIAGGNYNYNKPLVTGSLPAKAASLTGFNYGNDELSVSFQDMILGVISDQSDGIPRESKSLEERKTEDEELMVELVEACNDWVAAEQQRQLALRFLTELAPVDCALTALQYQELVEQLQSSI